MKIIRTYKYKLRLRPEQSKRIDSWIGTCRYVYNLALETKINAYKSGNINLSKFDLMKQITDLKDINWIADVPSGTLQQVCERLDRAYRTFFKVDAKFTSQKCNVCSHTDKSNRLNQSQFKCVKCGHQQNADLNAAKNIMSMGSTQYCQRRKLFQA